MYQNEQKFKNFLGRTPSPSSKGDTTSPHPSPSVLQFSRSTPSSLFFLTNQTLIAVAIITGTNFDLTTKPHLMDFVHEISGFWLALSHP